MAITRALWAEWLKTKHTLALWLAPLAPLVIVALQVAVVLERRGYYLQQNIRDPWAEYAGQTIFLWCVLMLPLFITLETALLSNLEHSNKQWKHLFALPIPRSAIYAAKQIGSMALIAVSMIALYVSIVLSGLVLRGILPDVGFDAPVPWIQLSQHIGLVYLASWLIISIHTWVGLRWHSFVIASAAGIVAVIAAVVVFQSSWAEWYPWTFAGIVSSSLEEGITRTAQLLIGSLGGIVAAIVGGWNVIRRDVL